MSFLIDIDYKTAGIPYELINPASFNLTAKTVRRCRKEWEMISDNPSCYDYWAKLGYPDAMDEANRHIFYEDEIEMSELTPTILMPGQSALFSTNELIQIKNGQVGFVFLRSGPARGGFEHRHAGLFDPGFGYPEPRPAVLKIKNDIVWPLIIRRDQSICQLIVFDGRKSEKPYQGKFRNQTGAEPPLGVK